MDIVLLVISIVGCITGIISLLIVILYNTFQIGKQKISVSERRGTYYFDSSVTKIKGASGVKYCAIVSLKVTNQSSYPITLDNAYIKTRSNYHLDEFRYDDIIVINNRGESWIDTEAIVRLPLKFEPFETKYFALAFPFFKNEVTDFGKPVEVPITIVTARKKQIIRVSIPEYHSLFLHD